jgi:4-amino-4-deoxy-L-arabinose transferase-like glycosyltransferase
MTRRRLPRRAARVVMWAGIAASAVLLAALLSRGWGRDAWTIGAAALFLLCVTTCIWAGVVGERSAREVRGAVDRFAADRRAALGAPHRDTETERRAI